jgi:glycosyltransferase involved in cell wall biosynthesis
VDALRAASERHEGSALTIFDVHSSIPRVWYKRAAMKYLDSYFARITFPLASRILVRAEDLVQGLPELNGERSKVRITPSGVRDEAFGTFDGERFRQKYSLDGSPLVLFLGRLNPLKGPQFLLDAAPKLVEEFPGICFAFVGPDQGGYVDALKRRVSELGLERRVRFTGLISEFTEKMDAYSACDVFVLPTSYEGTSQAIFEAMSRGRPVVATRVGGIPSQVEEGKQGFLVDYGDAAALADRVGAILRDGTLAKAMSDSARNRAEGYRYSKLVRDLLANYQEIVESVGN